MVLLLGLFLVALFAGLWMVTALSMAKEDNSIRHAVWLDLTLRTKLLSVAEQDRGSWWTVLDQLLRVFYEFPLFFFGLNGNYLIIKEMSGGVPAPFMSGFLEYTYEDVARQLNSTVQGRGRYLGGQTVIQKCFGHETLIFLSNGPSTPRHDQLKQVIMRGVRAFWVNETAASVRKTIDWLGEPEIPASANPDMNQIRRYLISTMWYRLFGASAGPKMVDVFHSYFIYVLACIYGEAIPAVLFPLPGGVASVRQQAYDAAAATPMAARLRLEVDAENARASDPAAYVDYGELLMQVVDGFLFAGMLGTDHHAGSVIARIRSDPGKYYPLFDADPYRFMVENARLDAPVSSVTSVLLDDRTVRIGSGHVSKSGEKVLVGGQDVLFRRDTPYILCITCANRDPNVFGSNADQFDPSRPELDKTLSWNGIEKLVARRQSPRGCPGHDLALDVTETLVRHFVNTAAPPTGVPSSGDCPDLIQCSKERQLGDALVYQRLERHVDWASSVVAALGIWLCAWQLFRRHPPADAVIIAVDRWDTTWARIQYIAVPTVVGVLTHNAVVGVLAFFFLQYSKRLQRGQPEHDVAGVLRLAFGSLPVSVFTVFLSAGFATSTWLCYLIAAVMLLPRLMSAKVPLRFAWRMAIAAHIAMYMGFLVDRALLLHSGVLGFGACLLAMSLTKWSMHMADHLAHSLRRRLVCALLLLAVAGLLLYLGLDDDFASFLVRHAVGLAVGAVLLLFCLLPDYWSTFWFAVPLELFSYTVSAFVGTVLVMGSFALGEYFVPTNLLIVVVYAAACLLAFVVMFTGEWKSVLLLAAPGLLALHSGRTLLALLLLSLFVLLLKDVDMQKLKIRARQRPSRRTPTLFSYLFVKNTALRRLLGIGVPVTLAVLAVVVPVALLGVDSGPYFGGINGRFANGDVCGNATTSAEPLCSQSVVVQLDGYTKLLYRLIRAEADANSAVPPPSADVIRRPVWRRELALIEALPFPWYLPHEDEDMQFEDSLDQIVAYLRDQLLHSPAIFPLQDLDLQYPSLDEGRRTLYLAAGPLALAPQRIAPDNDLTSDAALTKWAFYGLGAHLVRRLPAPSMQTPTPGQPGEQYVVDLLWMFDLETRAPFRRFGAAAYFDGQLRVTRITLRHSSNADIDYRPGAPGWPLAKFTWRSSLLVGVTLKDHLVTTHMKTANLFVWSAREALPTIHPIRALLAPFTYRTIDINMGASSNLCVELGVLHRATGLSAAGLLAGFRQSLETPWRPLLEDQLADKLDTVVPFVQDGLDFQTVVHRFVADYVQLFYPSDEALLQDVSMGRFIRHMTQPALDFHLPPIRGRDDLVCVLREFIMTVTAYHYQVGHVNEYVLDPAAATGKLRGDNTVGDVQSSIQTLIIALFTSFPQPMLLGNSSTTSPFLHLLVPDPKTEPRAAEIFNNFQAALTSLADDIAERNRHRPWPVYSFDPRSLMSAVSI